MVWFDPFEEMRSMRRRMRPWFGQWEPFGRERWPGADVRQPLADVVDEGSEVVAVLELPGMEKSDISVHATRDRLTVRAKKRVEKKEEKKGYYYQERSYSGYERSLALPTEIDPNAMHASYKNGILEVRMRKLKPAVKEEGKTVKVE